MSHAGFLRDQGLAEEHVVRLVRALTRAGEIASGCAAEDGVRAVTDAIPPDAGLETVEIAIVEYVARVTLAPRSLRARHLEPLRAAGLDDRALHDVVHVAACFAYMNRLADSLGVTVAGDERRGWAVRLLGADALADHDGWADGGG